MNPFARTTVLLRLVAFALLVGAGLGLRSAGAEVHPSDRLELYTVNTDARGLEVLRRSGFDLDEARRATAARLQLVMTASQREALAREGVKAELWRDADGL